MALGDSRGFPYRYIVIAIGVAGLLFARSLLSQGYSAVVKKATTPDRNRIETRGFDRPQTTMEFDSEQLVRSYNFSNPRK